MMFRVTDRCLPSVCIALWLAACGSDDGSPAQVGADDAQADHVDASPSDAGQEAERGSDGLNEHVDAPSKDVSQDQTITDSASPDADVYAERQPDTGSDRGTTDARDASGDRVDANLVDGAPDAASDDATDAASLDAGVGPGSDATAPDAASSDGEAGVDPFACLGAPLPTTAPATIHFQGIVDNANLTAVPGATVEGFVGSSVSAAASTTSAADGTFAFDLSSGGIPLDAYLHASGTGFFDTYHYPAYPVTVTPIGFTVLLIDAGTVTAFGALAGVTQDLSNGFMLIIVDDCTNSTVAGATVDVSPGGSVFYLRNQVPSPAATSTDSSGTAVVFNVPPGQVTAGASVGALTLRSHVVTVRAGTLTRTSVRP